MEYLLTRLFKEGSALSPHAKQREKRVRGLWTVNDCPVGHRVMRVAELRPSSGETPPPRLLDVDLVIVVPDYIVITGFESVPFGTLDGRICVRQAWHLAPAPVADLIRAETLVNKLAGLLSELGHPVDVAADLRG